MSRELYNKIISVEDTCSVTKIIDQNLNGFFDAFAEKEIEKALSRQDKEKLALFFEKHMDQAPCFGDYIYLYIYNTTDLKEQKDKDGKNRKYTDVSAGIYYDNYILPSFKNRLGKARASLNPDSKETLGTKKMILTGEKQPVRGDVFLFAFGLGMDVDTVSLILKKCLLEEDFDMKNYKEVIYYWCLKQNLPYSVMLQWEQYYNNLNPEDVYEGKITDSFENKDTLILSNMVKTRLTGEVYLKTYLLKLKQADEKSLQKKSAKKAFKELFRGFPKAVEGENSIDTNGMTEREILDEDYNYAQDLNVAKRIDVLNKLKQISLEKNREDLLPDEVLALLFKNLSFTKKSINNRFYNRTPVSRRELLTAEFILYMVGILDDEKEEHRYKTGNDRITFKNRKASWIDFSEMATSTLKDVGMQGFYVRNPYDLFLVYCIFHKDPFTYFMASWEKGERLGG